jgi:hypothetical protein
MSQFIITTKDGTQAEALIQYLRSLEFVKLEPLESDSKAEAVAKAKEFLTGLPNRPSRQSDVNKAVKSIRKKHGYQ